jgi:hypothetical protein
MNERSANEVPATPTRKVSGAGLLLSVGLCRLFNSAYWALAGGLGWGCGTALGEVVSLPNAGVVGGPVGLAVVMLVLLRINWGNPRSQVPHPLLAACGGAAVGGASLALLGPLSPANSLLIGGVVGFIVAPISAIMKQSFAPVAWGAAAVAALTASTLFAGTGFLIGGVIGWTAAGGISLFALALLAECLRREPAVEIDEHEQPVRVVPRGESFRRTALWCWRLTDPVAWGWDGLLAGLLAFLWGSWAAAQPEVRVVHQAFLIGGGLAVGALVLSLLGFMRRPDDQTK